MKIRACVFCSDLDFIKNSYLNLIVSIWKEQGLIGVLLNDMLLAPCRAYKIIWSSKDCWGNFKAEVEYENT